MSKTELKGNVEELNIRSIIGFDGSTIKGLVVHPDGKRVVYPLGNKITIQNWETKEQKFLFGHTNVISAIDVAKSGKYICSGQINHIGFKARVIIWDLDNLKQIAQHELHKVRVEAVSFSHNDRYVISLGGRDCGSVIVYDLEIGAVLCGAQVARGIQGDAAVLHSMCRRGESFLTAGENHLSVWTIDKEARNVRFVDVNMAKLKRSILCVDANERDEYCFCGTTTGDVLKIKLNFHYDSEILDPVKTPINVGCFAKLTKKKLPRGSVDLYQQGVRSIRLLPNNLLIIGAGDGTFEIVEETTGKISSDINIKYPSIPALKVRKSTNLHSSITSIQILNEKQVLAATVSCEIFAIDLEDFAPILLITCHTSTIYDIAFPNNFSEVFATASKDDVRVWSMWTMEELLRIKVQNFACSSVTFAYDGKSILTAWDDGVIRSFTPLSGRLIYAILDAHNKGVSALATTTCGGFIISGGCEGQVRLWEVCPYRQQLICTLKEHKGPVSAIHVNKSDDEAVSASTDGTCIIWDLKRQCRLQILFANTLFKCVKYYPTGVQILTGGSDRKLAYWEVFDGSLVRELEGSTSGTINALDICPSGDIFVSGGNDQIVKVWKYQEGITTHIGLGHSGVITAARFSPDNRVIVTASACGSVFVWENPFGGEEVGVEELVEKLEIPEEGEDVRDLSAATGRSSVGEVESKKSSSCRWSTSSGSTRSSTTKGSKKCDCND